MGGQFLLFNGLDASNHYGLWLTDGNVAGTHEITGIAGTYAQGLFPTNITLVNGKDLFVGFDANGVQGLWVTDGTAAGTHELAGIKGADPNGLFSQLYLPSIQFTSFKGRTLFAGRNASGSVGLLFPVSTHETI